MSDQASSRNVQGLAPRRIDPKRMLRSNRDAQLETTREEPSSEPHVVELPAAAAAATQPAPAAAPVSRSKKAPVSSTAKVAPVRVAAYVDEGVRGRAVAAFRATAHLEGEDSWSQFVERAIIAETQRREVEYNSGSPYAPSGKLPKGRPVKG